MRHAGVAVVGVVGVALVAAGCGGGSSGGSASSTGAASGAASSAAASTAHAVPKIKVDKGAAEKAMLQSVGKGEGRVNLINWAGYAEKDWVKPFQHQTGCTVNSKTAGTSDEMVTLMKTGQYDGVSASGDATLRLIAGRDVAPVNLKLIKNYADVFAGLRDQPHNTVDGVSYGVPHGRGANLLQYRTDIVKPAPDSWSAVFDPASPYKGKVTAYDSPIYIADAAVYLMATKPDLGIKNPYELDEKQFAAAVTLLKAQRGIVKEYWSDYAKQQAAFAGGDMVLGTTWQVITNALKAAKKPVAAILPKEGSTGWSDTWMISSKAKHPNCMYQWMNYILSPKANAMATEYFGEAPAVKGACALTTDKSFCQSYHADDEAFFSKIHYWTTPVKDCGDDRGRTCKDYADWTHAWTEIKG